MQSAIDQIEKIIKKNNIFQITETKKSEKTLFIKIKNDENFFVLMVKEAFEDKIVINTTNPVKFDDIPEEKNHYELANKFNTYAIGAKCIKIDGMKESFLFAREEMFSHKECRNEKLITSKILLSFEILKSSPELFSTYLDNDDDE